MCKHHISDTSPCGRKQVWSSCQRTYIPICSIKPYTRDSNQSMNRAAEVKLWNVSQMLFGECFTSVAGIPISIWSHVGLKVRLWWGCRAWKRIWDGGGRCRCRWNALICGWGFWMISSSGYCNGDWWWWKGVPLEKWWIVFAAEPVDLFSFLLDTVVDAVLSMIMLEVWESESGGGERKSELVLGWYAMVIGAMCVGLL